MNQQNEKTGLRQHDWRLWFRLGTIGFLLLLCSKAESQETLKFIAAPAADGNKLAVVEKSKDKKAGLPVLIAPSSKQGNRPKENVAKPSRKDVKKANANSEQWTILITPGVSSHPGTKSIATTTTFQLDRKTGKVIEPAVQQVAGTSETTKKKRKSKPKINQLLREKKPSKPADKKLPVITPNPQPLKLSSKKQSVNAVDYSQIYRLIPYSRAEYLANPAYRHEATLEILFGEQRPTVIHKQDRPKRVYNQPRLNEAQPRTMPPAMPWGWNGYYPGYYGGYGYNRGYGSYWPRNSTYRKYPTHYGPLFNRHAYPRYGYGYPYSY